MCLGTFVWTFGGVVDAVMVAMVLFGLAVILMLALWVKLLDWWYAIKRPNNRAEVVVSSRPGFVKRLVLSPMVAIALVAAAFCHLLAWVLDPKYKHEKAVKAFYGWM